MKNLKRALASLLVVVIIITIIPLSKINASAAWLSYSGSCGDGGVYQGRYGKNVTFEYYNDGLLVIKGNGNMMDFEHWMFGEYEYIDDKPVLYNAAYLYDGSNIKSVVIESGVTSIGYDAFYNCDAIESISIPETVTHINGLPYDIWGDYKSLNVITVDEKNPVYDSRNNCNALIHTATNTLIAGSNTTVIPDGITQISCGAFDYCAGLKNISIPASVMNIGQPAFSQCFSVREISVDENNPVYDSRYDCNAIIKTSDNTLVLGCQDSFIPYGVERIDKYSLSENCYVVIPSSVNYIDKDAFQPGGHTSYPWGIDIDYLGTEEQWKNITNGEYIAKHNTVRYNCSCAHNYRFFEYITEPDCTHEGTANYKCIFCGDTKVESVPIKHTLKHMTTSATCTNSGYEYDICTSCYQMFNYTIIPAKGHSWGEWVIDTPATCTSEGARHRICTACGDAREDEVIPAHGHSYKHMMNSATCEKDGTEYDICTECMDTKNIVILPKTGHDWSDWVFEPDATCTVDGLKYRICKNNNSEREDVVIKAEGHSYKDEVIAPTCEERGYTTHTCEKCGDVRIDTYVDAISHNFKWRTSVNPTTTSEGLMVKECTHCGLVADEMTIPELVPDYVTGLTLSSEKEAINIGETVTLTATVNPDTAKNKRIIWKSSEKDVATVTDGTVTALKPGVTVITAQTEDGGYKEYCLVRVIGIVPVADTQTVIDSENGLIYGLSVNATNIEDYIDVVDDKMIIESASSSIGTGTQINIIFDGKVIDTYETVIFGDTNGDSWYNGMDAMIVNCIANGMLTQDDVGEAAYMAADCNHDGAIDELDVELLQQAGLLLANVDQSKSEAELLATSSAYVEYLNLIDQKANADDGNAEEPADDDTSTDDVINQKTNAFAWLIDFIIKLFNYLKLYLR